MRVHYLQHEKHEGLGCIEEWLIKNQLEYAGTHLYVPHQLPLPGDFDGLIIMGGGASIYEEAKYPYLKEEKKFIRKCIDEGKTILGICLGSQLLAEVMGAKVYPGKQQEIGWFTVHFNEVLRERMMPDLPENFTVLHWHGDTFDIPSGARLIGSSEITPHQGFIYEDHVIALQFHFEINRKQLEVFIDGVGAELLPEEFVQTREELLGNAEIYEKENNRLMFRMLDNFFKK